MTGKSNSFLKNDKVPESLSNLQGLYALLDIHLLIVDKIDARNCYLLYLATAQIVDHAFRSDLSRQLFNGCSSAKIKTKTKLRATN